MEEYDENKVVEIATNYGILKKSLALLEEAKKDKQGVVLGYVSMHYQNASSALDKLKKAPSTLQVRLRIRELEELFLEFGNTSVKL